MAYWRGRGDGASWRLATCGVHGAMVFVKCETRFVVAVCFSVVLSLHGLWEVEGPLAYLGVVSVLCRLLVTPSPMWGCVVSWCLSMAKAVLL